MTWTHEAIAILRREWGKGQKSNWIAAKIRAETKQQLTRNAVIGKAHRLGLTKHGPSRFEYRDRKINPGSRRNKTTSVIALERSALVEGPKFPILRWKADPLPAEDARPAKLIALVDLEPHHCRYPYGDVRTGNLGFCGERHVPGLSYCAKHARMCLVPVERKLRAPADEKPRRFVGEYWDMSGRKRVSKIKERA